MKTLPPPPQHCAIQVEDDERDGILLLQPVLHVCRAGALENFLVLNSDLRVNFCYEFMGEEGGFAHLSGRGGEVERSL